MTEPARPQFGRTALVVWVAYWVLLFTSTHIPEPDMPDMPEYNDKVIHFCGYAILTLLGAFATTRHARRPFRALLMWSAIFVFYGALDEWLQGFVNRSPDIRDFFADAAGIVAGGVVWMVFRRLAARHAPTWFVTTP